MTGIRRLGLRAATALFLGLVPALPVQAQTLCSAPIAPFCVDVASTYEDAGTSERCRQDLESLVTEVDAYAACLDQQITELRNEQQALEALYACHAEGSQDCPQNGDIE